ncbi:MAG: hypothetical protein NZT92_20875 [Abditibacteriales bacterium]|nr:hypothetical protein [Abditibacteriales bacterium]MDW8368166.1 hypothetical protein [Abditibacteriales bacterium]
MDGSSEDACHGERSEAAPAEHCFTTFAVQPVALRRHRGYNPLTFFHKKARRKKF